ncbi:MAG: AsmA family protein, partial [Deltaproteobacteria bacterium]|nr:AsmA family protein [Deltaproteobacteria bacterium]
IVIRNGHVSYRDQRSGAVHEAALDELTVKMPSSDEAVKVRMLGSYNSMPFDVSGSLGSLRSILDPELSWSMDILVNTLGAKVALKGDVKNPLAIRGINAELSVDVKELDTLWRSLGMEMGVSGPLKLKAHVNDSEENVFLLKDLIVTQGESDIRGHGTIDLSKTKPFIFAAIDSDYLNLKPWLKVDKDKKKGKEHDGSDTKNAKGDKKKLLPSSELPFASLKSVDARVIVKAVRLVHPFLILDNVKVILKLRDGKLDINLGRFGAYGGSMQGNLSVDSNPQPPEIVVDFQATGVEVSSYLKEQGLSESVSGRVDVDVGLKGAGTSVAKIFSTINGNYFFTMGEGRIDNSKLGFLDESSLLTFLQLLNPSINMKKEPYTAINCVASGFEFTDGLAETNALLIDTSLMTVAGKGWVDFKTEKIRMSLSPTPKSAVDPSLYGVSLSQLAKPVRLGGTLSKPKLEMDPEQAAKILLKALGGESYLKTFEGLSTLGDGNGQQNPCVTALREGSSVTGEKGESGEKEEKIEKKILKDIPIEIPEEIEETLKDVEKGLKKIFGK